MTSTVTVPASQAGAAFTGKQSNMEKARLLVSMGFHVFPAYHEDTWIGDRLYERKTPLKGTRGFHSATNLLTDVEVIWGPQGNPNFLVAVACGASHIVVLDIDMSETNGKDGWANLWEAFGDEFQPTTLGYETSSGGHHYIYKATTPDHQALKNTRGYVTAQGEIIDDIDRRGKDGYIIWWGDAPTTIEELKAKVEEVPDWFAFQEPSSGDVHTPYDGLVADWMDRLPKGQAPSYFVKAFYDTIPTTPFGHADLIRLQRNIIGYAAEREEGAFEAIEALRAAWLRDPWNTPEYQQDWDTSLAGGIAKYGGAVSEAEKSFWEARPILQHIYRQSRSELRCSPWGLLGAAILRAIALTPWYVRYRSNLGAGSFNLSMVNVGGTSKGKSQLQRNVRDVIDFGEKIAPLEVGSGEAMSDSYGHWSEVYEEDENGKSKKTGKQAFNWSNPKHTNLFAFDEIGRLESMQSRQGSTILDYVKSGWSGAPFGRKLVNGSGGGTLLAEDTYRFTLFFNAQPKRSGVLFTSDEIAAGGPSRYVFINVHDPLVKEEAEDRPVEKKFVRLPEWEDPNKNNWAYLAGEPDAEPNYIEVHATEKMRAAHRADMDDEEKEDIDGHVLYTRAKVAFGFMILDGRKELNDEDWDLAGQLIAHSIATRNHIRSEIAKAKEEASEAIGRAQGHREAVAEETKATTKAERMLAKLKEAAEDKDFKYADFRKKAAHRDRDTYDAIAKEHGLDNREAAK